MSQAGDAEDVTEEALAFVRQSILAVGCTIPVSKLGYVELSRDLARELQATRGETESATRKLADREVLVVALHLKV